MFLVKKIIVIYQCVILSQKGKNILVVQVKIAFLLVVIFFSYRNWLGVGSGAASGVEGGGQPCNSGSDCCRLFNKDMPGVCLGEDDNGVSGNAANRRCQGIITTYDKLFINLNNLITTNFIL